MTEFWNNVLGSWKSPGIFGKQESGKLGTLKTAVHRELFLLLLLHVELFIRLKANP